MVVYLHPILGGMLIGLSASIMLLFNGRVTGVSGIISGILRMDGNDTVWRLLFVLGLIVGGVCFSNFDPEYAHRLNGLAWSWIIPAGLLVGFGTVMGGGCTSGHGICGISRLSIRSIIATIIFIGFGILTATAFRLFLGSPI